MNIIRNFKFIDRNNPNSYAKDWKPLGKYYPIDSYDTNSNGDDDAAKSFLDALTALKPHLTKYHFIKIPLLGQSNEFDIKKRWCGRAAAGMIYNYYTLLDGP